MLGYVGKKPDGTYSPFHWKSSLRSVDVELSDDIFIIQRESAEAYVAGKTVAGPTPGTTLPQNVAATPTRSPTTRHTPFFPTCACFGFSDGFRTCDMAWRRASAERMNFYTKVLSKFATQAGLKIGLEVDIAPEGGVSNQKVDEIRVALRELGLPDDVSVD